MEFFLSAENELSLEGQFAQEAFRLRDCMLQKQQRADRLSRKALHGKAATLARDNSTVDERTARRLLEKAHSRRPRPRNIRSDRLFGDEKGEFVIELDTRPMPVDRAHLTVYELSSSENGPGEQVVFTIVAEREAEGVSINAYEEGSRLQEDELYAPYGFVLAALASYNGNNS